MRQPFTTITMTRHLDENQLTTKSGLRFPKVGLRNQISPFSSGDFISDDATTNSEARRESTCGNGEIIERGSVVESDVVRRARTWGDLSRAVSNSSGLAVYFDFISR
jgi:hypothetical protein